jgi:hypothetical protein
VTTGLSSDSLTPPSLWRSLLCRQVHQWRNKQRSGTREGHQEQVFWRVFFLTNNLLFYFIFYEEEFEAALWCL